MPIHSGIDKDGSFYQWGSTGKKYHFNSDDKKSRQNALRKAKAQQTAIYSSGRKGDERMKMKLVKVTKKDSVKKSDNVSDDILDGLTTLTYPQESIKLLGYLSDYELGDMLEAAIKRAVANAPKLLAAIKSEKKKRGI